MQKDFPYPWASESITYLGIQLTSPSSKLFQLNYQPLVKTFQEEILRLQKFYLSWNGRLAAYKMLLLPKLIYIFRTLPIPLPNSFLKTMQNQMLKFIWAGKRARFSLQMQENHKQIGGLGVPNLKDYYTATILEQLKQWFANRDIKHWTHLEQTWLYPRSLQSLILAHNIQQITLKKDHPTIQATIKAWSHLKKSCNPQTALTDIPFPLETLKWLIPNISLDQWLNNQTILLRDIIQNGKLLPFKEIQHKLNIPSSEFLTYLQIDSWFNKWGVSSTPVPTKVWGYLSSFDTKAGGISMMYTQINTKKAFTKLAPLRKWEKDLNQSFTDNQWLSAFKCNHRFSRCSNYEELAAKLTARWHYTPYMMAKFSKENTNLCWRNCDQVGTLPHMLWSCKHIRSFWSETFKLIAKTTGVITKPTPEKAILSINMSEYPLSVRSIAMHILFAARSLLVSKWRSDEIPTIREIITKVNTISVYEKILAYKDGYGAKYLSNWNLWNSLYQNN